jgi:hypothetical protein
LLPKTSYQEIIEGLHALVYVSKSVGNIIIQIFNHGLVWLRDFNLSSLRTLSFPALLEVIQHDLAAANSLKSTWTRLFEEQ